MHWGFATIYVHSARGLFPGIRIVWGIVNNFSTTHLVHVSCWLCTCVYTLGCNEAAISHMSVWLVHACFSKWFLYVSSQWISRPVSHSQAGWGWTELTSLWMLRQGGLWQGLTPVQNWDIWFLNCVSLKRDREKTDWRQWSSQKTPIYLLILGFGGWNSMILTNYLKKRRWHGVPTVSDTWRY